MKTHTAEFYRSKGQWRWRIRARNGKIIGAASEGYKRRIDCSRAFYRMYAAMQTGTLKVIP
jgi:uncharacterized protein YegP (UPF0339 family)